MFIWAILAALALTAAADDDNCTTKTSGVQTSKSQFLFPVIEDGNCNLRVDLSFVYGCNNQGVYLSFCDLDAKPLVVIDNQLKYIDITREGHCRGEVFGFVQVYCQAPASPLAGAGGKARVKYLK